MAKVFFSEGSPSREERVKRNQVELVCKALLQRNDASKYYSLPFRDVQALQSVVTAMYYEMPHEDVEGDDLIPPLAVWTNEDGPRAVRREERMHKVALISFPERYRQGGLLAWMTLGHEVVGHCLLHKVLLLQRVKDAIEGAIRRAGLIDTERLVNYWTAEESASDVFAAMHVGPAFGVGLIGYLRGDRIEGEMKSSGKRRGPHPIDVLRPFIVAKALTMLGDHSLERSEWIGRIKEEANKSCQLEVRSLFPRL